MRTLILILLVLQGDTSKILIVFPTPSVSHVAVITPLVVELASRGHEVTLVVTPLSPIPDLLALNITLLTLPVEDVLKHQPAQPNPGTTDRWIEHNVAELEYVGKAFEELTQLKKIKELLSKGENYFDLLIIESWIRPLLALGHVFKAPVIQMSSSGANFLDYEAIGAPTHPILYSTLLQQRVYNLSQWEKLVKVYKYWRWQWEWARLDTYYDQIIQRTLGPGVPPLKQLACNVRTLILNEHPVWAGYRPDPPSVVRVWGIHLRPPQPLPEDLQSYLDSSANGVIYMSLGTNFQTFMLPENVVEMLVRVLSRLPYDVLLKWDQDELPGKPDNVRISKWFPQADVLRHPKVKLFITQGGMQSTDESIDAGVPLVGVPMISDQWFQTEQYARHGIGLQLCVPHLTEERLLATINKVITDGSYQRNVRRLRALLHDEPAPRGVARAVWYVEHAMRHLAPLRAPAACVSWAGYLEFQILTMVLLGSFIVTGLPAWAVYLGVRWVLVRRARKSKLR